MRKFFAFFLQAWVIALFCVVLISLLVWFVGPLVAIAGEVPLASAFVRLVVIVIAVLFWIMFLVLRALYREGGEAAAEKAAEPPAKPEPPPPAAAAAAPEAATAGPAADVEQTEEDQAELVERFSEAVTILRGSRMSGGALYGVPWYVFIGPPGAGKTSLILQSGLDFPLVGRIRKRPTKGADPTRNCDIWFTDKAVLLDTAGRYLLKTEKNNTAAPRPPNAWESFLGVLKQHRRQRPINGVILTLNLAEVMQQSEPERLAQAFFFRQRLQDLRKQLGIRFPVYVVWNQCDRIAGFSDFFEDLGQSERSQVWGMTFPLAAPGEEEAVPARFLAEYELLLEQIQRRVLWRMNMERGDLRRRALLFTFPYQMASLRNLLNDTLQEIFRQSRYEQPVLLRGVYFTSATQGEPPVDRLFAPKARELGLDPQAPPSPQGQGRGYFVHQLLTELVFREAGLAGSDEQYERRRRLMFWGAGAAALLVTGLLVWLWTDSYQRNQKAISRLAGLLTQYEATARDLVGAPDFMVVLPALDLAYELTTVFGEQLVDGIPVSMRWGLYQGRDLGQAATEAYRRELNNSLLPLLVLRLEQQLRENKDPIFLYETLKIYIMMADARHRDPALIKSWADLDWARTYPADLQMRQHLLDHLDRLLAGELADVQLDQGAVAEVRRNLERASLGQFLYDRIKREAAVTDRFAIRLVDLYGTGGGKYFALKDPGSIKEIPGIFTYRGFAEIFLMESHRVMSKIRQEGWVLGKEGPELSPEQLEKVKGALWGFYVAEYIRIWDKLLDQIQIAPFRDPAEAVQIVEALSSTQSPLRALLDAVEKNTSLTRLPVNTDKVTEALAQGGGAVGQLASQAMNEKKRMETLFAATGAPAVTSVNTTPMAAVERHFEPLNQLVRRPENGAPPLDHLIEMLAELYGKLNTTPAAVAAPPPPPAAGAAPAVAKPSAAGATGGGIAEVVQKLRVEAARKPEPMKRWLLEIATRSDTVVGAAEASRMEKEAQLAEQAAKEQNSEKAKAVVDKLNKTWQAELLPLCRTTIQGRYPVVRDAKTEIAVKDFSEFFGPGGVMDQFIKTTLTPLVDISAAEWHWKPLDKVPLGLSEAALQEFRRAAVIRDAFFEPAGKVPLVRFTLSPVSMDQKIQQFSLDLDGQKVVYHHGPIRPQALQWPGPLGAAVRLQIEPAAPSGKSLVVEEGPWGWFHVLDKAKLVTTSEPDLLQVAFDIDGRKVQYELRASSKLNPFFLPALADFRCPPQL
jgi:type VI secretion system protein ImpL